MTGFLARRPILAFVLLMLPLPGIAWGCFYMVFAMTPSASSPGGPPWDAGFAAIARVEFAVQRSLAVTHFIWPLLCCVPIALFRQRSGAPMNPFVLLAILSPVVIVIEYVAVSVCIALVKGEGIIESVVSLCDDFLEYPLALFVLPVIGVLSGLLIGRAVALRLIHSGRWETIVGIPKPREV